MGSSNFASSMIKGGDGNYYMTEVGPPASLYQFNPGTGALLCWVP